VGPKPNGALPEPQEDRLREMAAWYFLNHECIDSTRAWVVSKENNVLFTAKGKNLYAIVTEVPDWKEGERRSFTLHSVRAQPNTAVSVLGQNSKIMEYKPNADVRCTYQQTAAGLTVSVVKAQRIYDDHRWPNAVVIKLANVQPAIDEAVTVETTAAKPAATSTQLSGRLYNFKNKSVTRARFAYRAYRGRVETLYADPWQYSAWVPVSADGRFSGPVKTPKGAFEYKAVAEQSGVAVEGDTKLVN
jgi:alpha-L-fucosidase